MGDFDLIWLLGRLFPRLARVIVVSALVALPTFSQHVLLAVVKDESHRVTKQFNRLLPPTGPAPNSGDPRGPHQHNGAVGRRER